MTAAALAGTTPAASAARDDRPVWGDCAGKDAPADMRCAAIEVPVDWSRPDGPKITLSLARLAATEPRHRIGGVLGIPGGPGAKGIDDLKRAATDLTDLRRRFDLVAYDPRTTV